MENFPTEWTAYVLILNVNRYICRVERTASRWQQQSTVSSRRRVLCRGL